METKKIFAALVLFFLVVTAAVANPNPNEIALKGQSNTWLGDYQIKELPAVNQSGQSMRAFELSYANAEKTVLIYLDERPDCREYIVRSKNLEIKYVCNKSGFGAKYVTGKLRQYDPKVNDRFLATDEFNRQSKISEGQLELSTALGLIASYFPNLFNSTNLLD